MLKRLIALVLCVVLAATLAPNVHALPIQVEKQSRDQCCHTLRVNPLDVNYVRPNYDGYLIDITPQRVADTFAYLDEFYIQAHPEAALTVYTGTEQDRENLKKLAETITAGCTTNKQKADAIDSWLNRNIYYDVNTSAYASDTFYRRTGNCLSYANLMQFLLRSLGIPAVVGDGWRGDMKTSTVDLMNYEGHAWCFVYLDGEWVLYDPLWISGGTTDRDYMAENIYFDTVEFVCPASDGDNLPPVAYDKLVPYYTDGKVYMYSADFPQGVGTLSMFVNNQAYVFITNQCEGEYLDGWVYLDEGKSKDGMDRGEIYRDSWVSYGDYREDSAMLLSYAFPNGMMPDGYVMNYDGRDRYMSYTSSVPILLDAEDYWIQDGLVTLKPGYTGEFLGLPWQEGVISPEDEDCFVTWTSMFPEVATVDEQGVITCHAEGYAEFEIMLRRREQDGSLTYLSINHIQIFVSSEDRTPDYTDYEEHQHEFACIKRVEPDCVSWGYEIRQCIHCPVTMQVNTTPPLEHEYNADHICTRCGEVDPEWQESQPDGYCGDNVTWKLHDDGTLVISGTGAMTSDPWQTNGTYLRGITALVIEEGVTSILEGAFRDCSGVNSVTFPAAAAGTNAVTTNKSGLSTTLTDIGDCAFFGCSALKEITLPSSVRYVGEAAFMYCTGLTSITFTGDAPAIGEECFYAVEASVIYPANNPTWTQEVMRDYSGTLTWEPDGEVIAPTVKWSSISTSLGGNIAMNFYVELSENLVSDPEAYIQFTFAGRTLKVALSEGKPSDKNGVTVYQFSCPITSKNMTDEITAQVYNGSGKVGEPKSMSVDTYCNWVIANFKDEKTVNLMKGMLNYGASAQKLFNYRTDDLANATLAEEDKVFGAVDASAYKHSVTGTEEGIITKSMTLLLDSETTVRVYFELTGDKTIDQYTFTVDGVEVTPTYKDGKYYIERPNISAHRLDDMHVFTCGGITVTYGGLSYVNQVMTYYTEGATFEMASALYAYSKAAEAYIG